MLTVPTPGLTNLEESNAFLRALWSELRAEFGSIGWLFAPMKHGRRRVIEFGEISLNYAAQGNALVSIRYKTSGVIEAISFSEVRAHSTLSQDLQDCLRKRVQSALERKSSPAHFRTCLPLSFEPPLAIGRFAGQSWRIGPGGDGLAHLEIIVSAFDNIDAGDYFNSRSEVLMDLLAVYTNCAFSLRHAAQLDGNAWAQSQVDSFLGAEGWIDGRPIEDGLLRLPAHFIALFDDAIAGRRADLMRLTAASRLFHLALDLARGYPIAPLARQGYRAIEWSGRPDTLEAPPMGWVALDMNPLPPMQSDFMNRFADAARALLMSALEVASLTDEEYSTCASCNQPIYKISERVRKLAARHFGISINNIIRDHYTHRSKFLHVGKGRGARTFGGSVQPQLDIDSQTGCAMPHMSESALIEQVSYILRSEYKARVTVAGNAGMD